MMIKNDSSEEYVRVCGGIKIPPMAPRQASDNAIHNPEDRLAGAIYKFPPDWDAMEAAIKDGADVNFYYEDDDGDTILSELFFCYIQNKVGIIEKESDFDKIVKEKGLDGRYLPQITKFFLDHGFDVNMNGHGHGGMALYELLFSSYDGGMIESARLLLDAGADLTYQPYHEGDDLLYCVVDEWDMYNENAPWGEKDPVKAAALEKMADLFYEYAHKQGLVDADGNRIYEK